MLAVYREKRSTICFLRLGNERASISQRLYSIGTSEDLSKHFKRKYVEKFEEDEKSKCGVV